MGLGYLPIGLSVFLTFAFACAFLGATMGAFGVTRPARVGRRGLHPLAIGVAVAIGFAVVLHQGLLVGARGFLRGSGLQVFQSPLLFALIGVAGATWGVTRIGHARQVLAAASIATALSLFALPFVANASRSMDAVSALMGSYVPAALGLLLGASLAWSRRRQGEALRGLVQPTTVVHGVPAER